MHEKAWTSDATDVDRHLAVLAGDVFVSVAPTVPPAWGYGEVVRLDGIIVMSPSLTDNVLSPALADARVTASGLFGEEVDN